MIRATVELESASPYSQSRMHDTPKEAKERPDDYEKRVWREKAHVNKDGNLFIPPMVFKNCLSEAAKYLSQQVPGKGKQTFTKHFDAGVIVTDPLVLPEKKDTVPGEWINANADGKKGSGTRVKRCFPVVQAWKGKMTFLILDHTITEDAFKYHLEQAGSFIGIGRFRPRNGGYYGRFIVKKVDWQEQK